MPASVQVATVPAAPKSTSSGCAQITSARCTSSSSSTSAPYRGARRHIAPPDATRDNRVAMERETGSAPIWWPRVDAETQRELVAFLEDRGVRTEDIADAI